MLKFFYECKDLNKEKDQFPILEGGLLFLSSLSLFSVGFANWNVGVSGIDVNLVVEADTIAENKEDFKGTAYFVKGSEKCFDVFEYNGLTVYSRSTFSCQIKIRPDLLDAFFPDTDKKFTIGLYYNYTTAADPKIFNNTKIALSDNAICNVENSISAVLLSKTKEISSYIQDNGTTDNYLKYTVSLTSKMGASLSSVSKPYQNSTEFVFINVDIPFEIDKNMVSTFKNISFYFLTNLEETV